jgi:hypothetical protein
LEAAIRSIGRRPDQVDETLMRRVVNDAIVNKFEFGVAIAEAARRPTDRRASYGPLRKVVITGDKATGSAEDKINAIGPLNGPKPVQRDYVPGFDTDSGFQFRKTNEGWLISGFGGGDTAEPRPNPAKDSAPPERYYRP